jgi:hypothetical protein
MSGPSTGARRRPTPLFVVCAAVVALAGASAAQASPVDPSYVRVVPNQSSRGGAVPELIVIHATTDPNATGGPVFRDRPGIKDLVHLGNWFAKPRSQVSSHVANDAEGNDARYVSDGRSAWTEVAFNSVSLAIEQIGSVGFDRATWMKRRPQLIDTARWIAHWHRRWGIPIQRATVDGSTVTAPGIATHAQLGRAGGGHSDPGPGYPLAYVLRLARSFG